MWPRCFCHFFFCNCPANLEEAVDVVWLFMDEDALFIDEDLLFRVENVLLTWLFLDEAVLLIDEVVLLIDEDVRSHGAIEQDKPVEELRHEPYSLPVGFEWDSLDIDNPLVVRISHTHSD